QAVIEKNRADQKADEALIEKKRANQKADEALINAERASHETKRAKASEQKAYESLKIAEAGLEFLGGKWVDSLAVEGPFSQTPRAIGERLLAAEILDRAVSRIRLRVDKRPSEAAAILNAIGNGYRGLGT